MGCWGGFAGSYVARGPLPDRPDDYAKVLAQLEWVYEESTTGPSGLEMLPKYYERKRALVITHEVLSGPYWLLGVAVVLLLLGSLEIPRGGTGFEADRRPFSRSLQGYADVWPCVTFLRSEKGAAIGSQESNVRSRDWVARSERRRRACRLCKGRTPFACAQSVPPVEADITYLTRDKRNLIPRQARISAITAR